MHVIVNAATSADGKLSTREREQIEISGPSDYERVDQLRADSAAVMVGVGTVLADDPSLTVKDEQRVAERRERGAPEQPARVVADSTGRTPADARILNDAAETYLLVSEQASDESLDRYESVGATVIIAGEERVDLPPAVAALEANGIDRLMVEGGGELIFSLFAAGLVDDLSVFVGPTVFGGGDAPTLADGEGFLEDFPELTLQRVERLDDGALLEWTVG